MQLVMSRGGRLLILPLAWLAASAAVAQGVLTLEFSFSNPGARSLGFGGAFVALADDATAAYANPAGLNQLTRPEISLEGRSWRYSTPFVVGGRASGLPGSPNTCRSLAHRTSKCGSRRRCFSPEISAGHIQRRL